MHRTRSQRWQALSPGTRRVLVVAGAAEAVLKAAALVDLARRPADLVRGPKWRWALVIATVNGFGVAPLAYYRWGRRTAGASQAG